MRCPARHTRPGSSLIASAPSGSVAEEVDGLGGAAPIGVGVQDRPGVHDVVGEQHDPGHHEHPPRRAVAGGQQREARDELRHVRAPHRVLAEQDHERWRPPT